MEKVIAQIQEYIANNEIDLALKKLQRIFSLSNSELVNDAILLSAQLKKLQSDVRKGILDYSQENLMQNRIANSVLSLLVEIRDEPDRFAEFNKMEADLAQSIKEKTKEELPVEIKDALFERLSYIKGKALSIPAIWIDDSPAYNRYEDNILSSIGVQIDHVNSSEEAYKMIREKTYALILSDINRNGKEGEGLRFHRQLIEAKIDIPLIFYAMSIDKARGVPPYAFGIANLPNDLIHLVLDVIERKF